MINKNVLIKRYFMSLQNFILEEALKLDYAERYLIFKERYYQEIFVDLKQKLAKAWEKEISFCERKYKIDKEDVELSLIKNENATIKMSVVSKTEKVVSYRNRGPIEAAASVKIPLLYSRHERDLIIVRLIDISNSVLKELTNDWSEIFKVEKQGRAIPWFKIVKDHDEIRLQFALSSGKSEMYKTLYSVRVEYGKDSSRTKDFDRVYLVSN